MATCVQMPGPDPRPMELCFAKCCDEGWPALHAGHTTELLIKPGSYQLIGFLPQRCQFCFIVGYGLLGYAPTFFIAEIWPCLRLRHFSVPYCLCHVATVFFIWGWSLSKPQLFWVLWCPRLLQGLFKMLLLLQRSCGGFCFMWYFLHVTLLAVLFVSS